MEHGLMLALLWGGGTLVVLYLIRFIFTLIPNPFDELDDEDIKEIDEMGKNITDLGGKVDGL